MAEGNEETITERGESNQTGISILCTRCRIEGKRCSYYREFSKARIRGNNVVLNQHVIEVRGAKDINLYTEGR